VWDFNEGERAQTSGLSLDLGKNEEFVGDYRSRRNSRRLKLDRVVDTPRRARSSIGKSRDHDIALLHQLLDAIGFGATHLSFEDDFDPVESPAQQFADIAEKSIGIGLAVVQQTNAFMMQTKIFPGGET
jgi:hypothetical protein